MVGYIANHLTLYFIIWLSFLMPLLRLVPSSYSLVLSWSHCLPFSHFVPMFLFSLSHPVIFKSVTLPHLRFQPVTFLSVFVSFRKKSITENQGRRPWHGQFAVHPPPTLPDNHFTVAFCHKLGCLLYWYIFNVLCVCVCVSFYICHCLHRRQQAMLALRLRWNQVNGILSCTFLCLLSSSCLAISFSII